MSNCADSHTTTREPAAGRQPFNADFSEGNGRNDSPCGKQLPVFEEIAHDMRSALFVVKEHSLLLQDGFCGRVNDHQQHMLATVVDRASDFQFLVDALLLIARLDAGSLSLQPEACAPGSIIDQVRRRLAEKASANNVLLDFDHEISMPVVSCDSALTSLALVAIGRYALRRLGERKTLALTVESSADTLGFRFRYAGQQPDPRHCEGVRAQAKRQINDGTYSCDLDLGWAREIGELMTGGVRIETSAKLQHIVFDVPLGTRSDLENAH